MFLLLLDCVWQLWRQFPLALGFSEALLLRLATEVYASDYGTFLCNSDQERSVFSTYLKIAAECLHFKLRFTLCLPFNQVCLGSKGKDSLLVPGSAKAHGEGLLL